ncbi:MAG TPA: ComEC/Rec2 family competence protein [Kiritimatiellia bacterium]|nr:ComEC/Rec2 family competence protein [Kiritimatiellia bacterium]
MTRNNLIAFCYLYIGGILLAMTYPVDASWDRALLIGAIGSFLPITAFALAVMFRGATLDGGLRATLWVLLALPALVLGYSRYHSADRVHDASLGVIDFASMSESRLSHPPAGTSRLRVRLLEAPAGELVFRLTGEADVRIPVRDEGGRPRLDEQGRWLFEVVRTPMTSEVIRFEASDGAGLERMIDQPFTRLDSVEVLSGGASGQVEVFQIANHVRSFVRGRGGQSPVTVLGRVSQDPRVFGFRTVLFITPSFIQYPAGGPFYAIDGGDIQVTIQPDMKGYAAFARTEATGVDVVFEGELTFARGPSNPGGFDAARFLQNNNVYGTMFLYAPRFGPPPMERIEAGEAGFRGASPLVRFSLGLRDDVLRVIKQTMPFPQSAFLGGVTLGLRYGLQGVTWEGGSSDDPSADVVMQSTIADDFRASGVNHVLAVSGLHVTILTVMFLAIFTSLRLPKQVYVPMVILALVVFAIITGARPSTLRAVIMNSLFLLTWAYLNQGLRSSILLGVPVAAFLILVHNPLVVVDPSLTLSFGAILSLALLTGPLHDLCLRLKGSVFVAAVLTLVGLSAAGVANWFLATSIWFLVPFAVSAGMLFWGATLLRKRGNDPFARVGFASIPNSISTFLAAQLAIQIGMMIPLSAIYFSRWPFAGAYANLIAIPLIGIVVQLAALGGLMGLIPVVGSWVALTMNAANWLGASLFIWVAHFFASTFPYPYVRRPTVRELLVYYGIISAWIWFPVWHGRVKGWCEARGWTQRWAPWAVAGIPAVVVAGLLLGTQEPRVARDVAVVEVLSVGYGSAVHVRSPGGRDVLLDSGFRELGRSRRNEAERSVLPYFSHVGVRSLDAVVLTSPALERTGGVSYLLDHIRADTLWMPDGLVDLIQTHGGNRGFRQEFDRDALVSRLVADAAHPGMRTLTTVLQERGDRKVNQMARSVVAPKALTAGAAILEEDHGIRGGFRIVPVGIGAVTADDEGNIRQGSALRIEFGKGSILYAADLTTEEAGRLPRSLLSADVLVLPRQALLDPPGDPVVNAGALEEEVGKWIDWVNPSVVILEYGFPRSVVGVRSRSAVDRFRIIERYFHHEQPEIRFLVTDQSGSVRVTLDGMGLAVQTQQERNRAGGGDADDTVSSMAIGL